jgi:hypothetical protein
MTRNEFTFASSYRFYKDVEENQLHTSQQQIDLYESIHTTDSIRVSKELTPDLFTCMKLSCNRLKVPISKIKLFVTSNHQTNAICMSFGRKSAIIILYSELVNKMSLEEIQFVIGHEIGHFLFGHQLRLDENSNKSDFAQSRAQEISSDRCGLIACQNIDMAVKSMIRIQSGLHDKFLRFDPTAFLDQLSKEKGALRHMSDNSHPTFRLRAKALLRFSISNPYLDIIGTGSGIEISKIDKLINRDLNLYVKTGAKNDLDDIRTNLAFWSLVFICIKEGSLSKHNQALIKELHGQKMLKQLVNTLKDFSPNKANKFVTQKVIDNCNAIRSISKITGWIEIRSIVKDVEVKSGYSNLYTEIQKII